MLFNCLFNQKIISFAVMKTVRGRAKAQSTKSGTSIQGEVHRISEDEITSLRKKLLDWYDCNKRELPWRQVKGADTNQHAYAVWVSEIMCQQTQVATVIDYYNKWMKKWPTLQSLSKASLEEVREMWSGLGYYSRGQRLLEGSLKVQNELGGQIPDNAEQLQKQLPGVGRYTAGAMASIVFDEATGVVDGNVVRVLSRMRTIGADSTSQTAMSAIWDLANSVVDPDRPGDFNQSMMELGATVCLPKNPHCSSCPVNGHCNALKQVDRWKREAASRLTTSNGQSALKDDVPDIECLAEECTLCASGPLDMSEGVMNYPRKPKKKPPKQQVHAVCVIEKVSSDKVPEYLMVQRPDTGLLAGLWEFPSAEITGDMPEQKRRNQMDSYLRGTLKMDARNTKNRKSVGQVIHIFSHIHQTYEVESFQVTLSEVKGRGKESGDTPAYQWVSKASMKEMALSTAMRKVFNAFDGHTKNPNKRVKSSSGEENGKASKQRKLDSYFTKK